MGDRTSIRILNSRFERRSSGLLTTSFAATEGKNQEENLRKSVLYGEQLVTTTRKSKTSASARGITDPLSPIKQYKGS